MPDARWPMANGQWPIGLLGKERETFWILAGDTPIGLLHLFGLADPTPMFDLRLLASCGDRATAPRSSPG
jgi:hypothetical protein